MNILLVGGGSGGHIIPVLAVADALKKKDPSITLTYAIGKGDALADIPGQHPAIHRVVRVRAGKFRRYHGEGLRQILDIPTLLKNIRDFFYFLIGIFQSYFMLGKVKPEVIFIKGGFVGVPVGLAAVMRGIPFITHDSDAIPGLANRIIAKWARVHAVAQPKDLYNYPVEKTVTVGVPVAPEYRPVSVKQQALWRESLGIPPKSLVLLVTGGGNGSRLINQAIIAGSGDLMAKYRNLWILHIAGRKMLQEVVDGYAKQLGDESVRVKVYDFVTGLHEYSGASDIIVTRAGANSLADFAQQQRACVVVPNPKLTGGHQLKNAEALERRGAIAVVQEKDVLDNQELSKKIGGLLDNTTERQKLAKTLHETAIPDAAERLAQILLENRRK